MGLRPDAMAERGSVRILRSGDRAAGATAALVLLLVPLAAVALDGSVAAGAAVDRQPGASGAVGAERTGCTRAKADVRSAARSVRRAKQRLRAAETDAAKKQAKRRLRAAKQRLSRAKRARDAACNRAPIADAGPDREVHVVDSVRLDGGGSRDPDGDSLTYRWSLLSQPEQSEAALAGARSRTPVLEPDRPGEYLLSLVVDDGRARSEVDRVRIDAASQVVRFAVIGAQGAGNIGQTAVAGAIDSTCEQRGCDFVIGVGNNIFDNGVSSTGDAQFATKFENPYAGIELPFWLGLGNHDYGGNGAATEPEKAQYQVDYTAVAPASKWRMPAHYYRRVDEHVEFFTLDTTPQLLGTDAQQELDVSSWLADSDAYWKIALGMHSYRSNGPHGNAGNYDGLPFPPSNGAGVAAFMEDHVCGVADVHFSGFDRSLQWPKQDDASCRGTELIVSGAGSNTTPLEDPPAYPTHFQAQSLGFAFVEIEDRSLSVDFVDTSSTVLFSRMITR